MGVFPFIRLGSDLLTKGMNVFQRLLGTNTLAYPDDEKKVLWQRRQTTSDSDMKIERLQDLKL
jgi:hypothetical protein